jgi:anthranilate synthase/aminodeoxychorismate synthase-like glutamine amidotransferase
MILVIDNYDSFTFNLVQYIGELGGAPLVKRNDELTVEEAAALDPAGVIVSPGPGTPAEAGISIDLIRRCAGRVPVLGVCLGHQALAVAVGGKVVRAGRLMHGKTSSILHAGRGILRGLPSPLTAMRYHSLLVERRSLPPWLEETAWTEDFGAVREIMGLQHEADRLFGVQFHPESIGTPAGKRLIQNFLEVVGDPRRPLGASRAQ